MQMKNDFPAVCPPVFLLHFPICAFAYTPTLFFVFSIFYFAKSKRQTNDCNANKPLYYGVPVGLYCPIYWENIVINCISAFVECILNNLVHKFIDVSYNKMNNKLIHLY